MFLIMLSRRGDGAKAHELSQEGKRHQAEQDKLDDQASEWIYNGAFASKFSVLDCVPALHSLPQER